MGPNVQHYDFTHKWENLCTLDTCRGKPLNAPKEVRKGSLLGVIDSKPEFSKMRRIVRIARQEELLQKPAYNSNHTLFVTENKNIPDEFMSSIDFDRARKFIRAYILQGTAGIQYLLENGDSIYTTFNADTPMLSIVTLQNKPMYNANDLHRSRETKQPLEGVIMINKVGKVINEIKCDNGMIVVMDNIADI